MVLSCCGTGCGDITADGVGGLGRAFLIAGAKCVVQTLWSVPDLPTQQLIGSLYDALLEGNTVERALRLASTEQQDRLEAWGAFFCIGAPGVTLPHQLPKELVSVSVLMQQ